MPGVVPGLGFGWIGRGRRALVGFEHSLSLQANRGQNLVVPIDVTTRAVLFADQFGVQADRLVGLRVVFRIDANAGLLGKLSKQLLSEFLVLRAVEDHAIRIAGTAAPGEKD